MLQCLLWASLVCAALAQQLPLLTSTHDDSIKTPRIAVIGAGPAGSFAAYSLGHFLPNQDPSWTSEVHLFERSNYIGGRSTTIHLKDASTENEDVYAELGASIFVNANRNLRKAARVFGLTTQDGHGESDHLTNKPFAIYDGERFVFQQSSFKYWDLARLLFWYGRSPFNARKLVRQAIQSFVTLYSAETAAKGPFSMQNYLELLSFGDLVQEPALTYYSRNGVSANFINDIISSACSVNYAQSAFKMHAVGGLVSMAADGATSIKGGNKLIFEEFVKRSKAAVHLETQVKRIKKLPSTNGKPEWEVQYVEDGLTTADVFDAVILAAPFASSGIEMVNTDAASLVPPLPYVDLHVTLVRTNASAPQSCFFNPAWSCSLPAPNTIYTALDAHEQGRIDTRPVINSLNYLKELQDGSYLVKLFSRATLTQGDLARAFGNDNILWSYEKVWEAYPHLQPIDPSNFAPIVLDEGLYYPSAFEALISTMETSLVSSWNVVAHVMKDFHGVQLNKTWAEW